MDEEVKVYTETDFIYVEYKGVLTKINIWTEEEEIIKIKSKKPIQNNQNL